MEIKSVSVEVAGKPLILETGKLAKQAHGSVLVSYGDTRVLVTAVSAKDAKPGQSFFPLTVEFQEKFYAAGRIPGSFHKREGRPTENATLSARMIDRPIRPLFPKGYLNDTQVVATVLSYDPTADVDVCAAAGASAALHISDIPFNGPTAAVRIGRVNGEFVINPAYELIENNSTEMEILVAGTSEAITMVEGGAREVSEEVVLEAIVKGHEEIKRICSAVNELREKCGKEKREFIPVEIPSDIVQEVDSKARGPLDDATQIQDKKERYSKIDEIKAGVVADLITDQMKEQDAQKASEREAFVKSTLDKLHADVVRKRILDKGVRIDGRDTKTIRPIACEVGLLPKAHGSALFTRGETQVLATVTLGTGEDEQIIDNIYQKGYRQVMLHYNFPPYSVGETGRFGGNSRREIGHGALAERSVKEILPSHEDFPYTIRLVCETLESNGSSSMGSVCSASMAAMSCGIPTKAPVAGIAMGLIKEGDQVAILSDILGDEDHLGDMDFKVAGTQNGVTGIQMDIKIEGLSQEILQTALQQAREGRLHILGEMAKAIQTPVQELSDQAPRITTVKVPTDKIAIIIGPGGKQIKEITAQTGVKMDINDDGIVRIASSDADAVKRAVDWVKGLTAQVELNATYKGTVRKITDFGAFVNVLPNQDGLLHVSEIAYERVNNVNDFFKEGDEVDVKVIEIDRDGKIRLSRKALLEMPEGYTPPPPRERGGRGGDRGGRGGDRGGRGGGDRGGRGGDRGGRGGGDRGGRGGSGGGGDRGRGDRTFRH